MKSTPSRSSGTVARTGLFVMALAGFVTVSGAALASEWDQWNDAGTWGEVSTNEIVPEPSNVAWGEVQLTQEGSFDAPHSSPEVQPFSEQDTLSSAETLVASSAASGDVWQPQFFWSHEAASSLSAPPRSPAPTSRPGLPVRCLEGLQWCDATNSCLTSSECGFQSQCPPPGGSLCSAGDVVYGMTCPPLTVCDQCHSADDACSASYRLIVPGCVANASGNPPYEPCACDGGYVAVGNECVPDSNSCRDLGIPWCGNGILMDQCPQLATCDLQQCFEASGTSCETYVKWLPTGCVEGAAGNPPYEPCACFEGYVRDGDRCVRARQCVPNMGSPCTSAPNACGQTSGGTIQCDGSCSASVPPISGTHLACVAAQCQVVPNSAASCSDSCASQGIQCD